MIVDIPGVGKVQFPDSMSQEQVNQVVMQTYRDAAVKSDRPLPGQGADQWKAMKAEAAKAGRLSGVQSPQGMAMDEKARVAMNDPGIATTAMLSAGQGLTMGFSDEIAAGLVAPFSDRTYDQLLATARGGIKGGKEANPKTAITAEIGGAIVPALVSGGAALPASGTMLGKSAIGAGIGALQGGAYGFGTGEDGLENRARSAAEAGIIGGIGGAAAPGIVAALRAPVSMVSNAAKSALNIGSETQASTLIKRMIERSGMTPDQVQAAVTQAANEGQPMFGIADAAGASGQRALSGVTRQPGGARTVVTDAMMQRQGGQANRLGRFITDEMGTPDTAKMTEAVTRAERGLAARGNYGAVRDQAAPVDVRGALGLIDDRLGPMAGSGVAGDGIDGQFAKFRSRLATPAGTDPNMQLSDFQRVFGVKQDVDDAIGAAVRAGRNNEARELGNLKRAIDDALAKSSAGYTSARDEFAAASRAMEAVDVGKKAASGTVRVEDNARAYAPLAPAEQEGFRAGYVDPLMAKLDASAVGVNKARPFTSEKSQADFGMMARDPAKLQRQIGRENTMFETGNAAFGGSRTADNLADNAETNGALSSMLVNLVSGRWGTAGQQIVDKVAGAASGTGPATREMVAKLLMSQDVQAAMTPAMKKAIKSGGMDNALTAIMRAALISNAQ